MSYCMLSARPADNITVNRVEIIGAKALKEDQIKAVMRLKEHKLFSKTRFDRRLLRMDAISVKTFYRSKGFLEVTVKDSFAIRDDQADVFLIIKEGKQYYLRSVVIRGNRIVSDKTISNLMGLRKHKPYDPVTANSNIATVEAEYQRYGKLFCVVRVSDVIRDSVNVLIQIDEGPDVYIHSYFIEGLKQLDTSIVKRELVFKPGDKYNRDDIIRSQRRLIETGVFSAANITPIQVANSDSTVNLLIELRQFKPREWISEGGYYPIEFYEGVEPFPGIGGEVEWRNRSLLKTTTSFSTKLTGHIPIGQEIYYPRIRFDTSFRNQWILGYRIPTQIKAYYETFKNYGQKDNPNIHRYGLTVSNLYRFSDRSFFDSGLRWEKFIEPKSLKKDIEQRSFTIKLHLDGTDNPLYPQKGWMLDMDLNQTGGILGGSRDFLKMDFGVNKYVPVSGGVVLAGRIKYGMMFGWDKTYRDIRYDKFYLGGSTSLRAWETLKFQTVEVVDESGKKTEIPYGNTIRILTNWEIRFPLFWLIGGEIFADGGLLTDNVSFVTPQNIVWDIGVGVTLSTPLGPIRLDYAVPVKQLNVWELQLGVHYIF